MVYVKYKWISNIVNAKCQRVLVQKSAIFVYFLYVNSLFISLLSLNIL